MSEQDQDLEAYSLSDLASSAPAPVGPFRPRAAPADVDPERAPWHRGALETFDVFSLIANKMIGTGIYSAPATVFLLTGNKSLTLGLFGVGFLYSLVSMVMYLDYAAAWPYTGGELVYLDEITAHAVEYEDDSTSDPDQTAIGHIPSSAHERRPTATEITTPRVNANDVSTTVPLAGIASRSTRQSHQIDANASAPHASFNASARRAPRNYIKNFFRQLLGDGLLAYITYSLSFIGVFNSGTNSMQTGRMILICIAASETAAGTTSDINLHLARLIGFVVLTSICLIQYFSPNIGRKLNRLLATVKILFLIALFLVAAAANAEPLMTPGPEPEEVDRAADWSQWHKPEPIEGRPVVERTWVTFAKALLAVLFSFEGWENATFVTGEIPPDRQHVLRRGFIAAVFTVGILYLLVVAVFLHSISWEAVDAARRNVHYAALLTGDGVVARRAWAVVGAISSIGSLNSIIYTFSRVKQVIGQAEVVPWSKVWKRDDRIQRSSRGLIIANDDPSAYIHKSPEGGLLIHWCMSVVVIAGSTSITATIESVQLPGYIQTYVHCAVLMVLGAAYLNLNSREWALTPPRREHLDPGQTTPPFRPSQAESTVAKWFLKLAVFAYVLLNLAILIINALGPYVGSDGGSVSFKGYGFPIIAGSLLLFSTTYYLLIFGNARRIYPHPVPAGSEDQEPSPPIVEDGIISPQGWSLLKWAGVECEIVKDRYYNPRLERVHRFGRRWRIMYYVAGERPVRPGDSEHHTTDDSPAVNGRVDYSLQQQQQQQQQQQNGQQNNQLANQNNRLTWSMFLYWLFGGTA